MNIKKWAGVLVGMGLMASGAAQAALIDRGGGLIYDDALNITWLQDANYAKTSGYDADGRMTWSQATAWASNLVYHDSVRNVDYSDWRLPSTSFNSGQCFSGIASVGSNCGYNPPLGNSEMAHLWYGDFANKSYYDKNFIYQPGWGTVDDPSNPNDESLFTNIQADIYWSGVIFEGLWEGPRNSSGAIIFDTYVGRQMAITTDYPAFAWAVRSGDVASVPSNQQVPEPSTLALLLIGGSLCLTLGLGRNRKAPRIN